MIRRILTGDTLTAAITQIITITTSGTAAITLISCWI
jgi:hypothetical protein